MMLVEHASRLLYYVREGGFVTGCLMASMFILWGALGYRITVLKRGTSKTPRQLLEICATGLPLKDRGLLPTAALHAFHLTQEHRGELRDRLTVDFYNMFEGRLGRFSVLVKSLVVVAPLTGLLGTVSGMMETFQSLDGATFQAQSGGIAGGIAEALIATQLGLAVAIPGLLVGRVLQRREETLRDQLQEIQELVCAWWAPSEESDASPVPSY